MTGDHMTMRYIRPGEPTTASGELRNVRKFKSLKLALKELEPFIRNGRHLQIGDEFKNFGMLRSRELLGNWLLCVATNATVGDDRYTFTTDTDGGDGHIVNERNGSVLATEHVFVPGPHPGAPTGRIDTEPMALILEKIEHKNDPKYAGRSLVVLCNDGGTGAAWYPNRLAKSLPDGLPFEAVWVMSLQGVFEGAYTYGVTWLQFGLRPEGVPVWRVTIAPDFDSWTVEQLQ